MQNKKTDAALTRKKKSGDVLTPLPRIFVRLETVDEELEKELGKARQLWSAAKAPPEEARPQVGSFVLSDAATREPSNVTIRATEHLARRELETEFPGRFLTTGTEEYKQWEAAMTKEGIATLTALRLLRDVETVRLPLVGELADAAELLLGWRPPSDLKVHGDRGEWAINPDPAIRRKGASWWWRFLFTKEMKGAWLEMAETEGGFTPAIFCHSLRTATFVYEAFKGIETCPACRRLFAPNPEREQVYCGPACAARIYSRTYRRKQKKRARRRKRR
jgi:hypothetical protein